MNDKDEQIFKEWIANGLRELRFASDTAFLKIPREVLRTKFEKGSDIVVMNSNIIKP